ncbi:formin-2 [Plakobranchus ocellatus]|uniref:Formin-2 n=1 Tax=Plakobranchus ocellatus TaxID=259542 RepID=A0AAV4BEE0_9GAST|nr:formin-2 [Plakobranchus ocellatus]
MNKGKGSPTRTRNRNVFKGSVLVSLLVESHPDRFPSRSAALRLASQLFRSGHIKSIFGASDFEDSAQLYVWDDDDAKRRADGHLRGWNNTMTLPASSTCSNPALPSSRSEAKAHDRAHGESIDWKLVEDVKSKVLNRTETYNIVTSYNTFFQELERDFGFDHKTQTSLNPALGGSDVSWSGLAGRSGTTPYTSTLELKKQNSAHKSSDKQAPSRQVEKDVVRKAVVEVSEVDQISTQAAQSSIHTETSYSRTSDFKHSSKQNSVIYPLVGKDYTRRGDNSPAKACHQFSKEVNPIKPSAQSHTNKASPSKASGFSPPAAVVKPNQNRDYRHHQYENQRSLRNPSGVSSPQKPHSSDKTCEKSIHYPRDHKHSHNMDTDLASYFMNPKSYPKAFNPGSNTHPNSQPSTLESGIGSSHPDTTSNSGATSSNPQHFSSGAPENPGSHLYHQNHNQQGHTLHARRHSKDSHITAPESHQRQNHSSPPEVPKWPDSSRGNYEDHPALRESLIPESRDKSAGRIREKGNEDAVLGVGHAFEIHENVDLVSSATRNYGGLATNNANSLSHLHAMNDTIGVSNDVGGIGGARRWATDVGVVHMVDGNNSYSDNEKQLLEEMRRMKQEHQSVLRTYEGRVNKLMAKMHELRNIAEMLENSSSKPLPGKLALLDILVLLIPSSFLLPTRITPTISDLTNINTSTSSTSYITAMRLDLSQLQFRFPNSTAEDKDLSEKREPGSATTTAPTTTNITAINSTDNTSQMVVPPPLPPRPSRGTRIYPNKPIIHTSAQMRPLPWNRIILDDEGTEPPSNTVWHGMREPTLDTEELERLFSGGNEQSSDVNLYDDVCLRRGRAKTQLTSIYDNERSQRIVSELRALPCTLPEVIQAFVTLNSSDLHTDSFAELLELLTSARELDKILHYVKRKGAGQLEAPEYLVYELSKVDHFRERLEFLRFKNKLQINLFEIDQQLKELNTACEEVTSSLSLKNVLETVLAVGNHMNAGTDRGQADGFRVDVLNHLKDIHDTVNRGNLLELVMRIYCLKYESGLDLGCPTRFQLPEPSNMRHASQVSFEDIQRALKELKEELAYVRGKLEALSMKEGNTVTIALRVTSENFMTSAVEVLAEEHKLLETTRIQFWKTASYFSQDGQKISPKEFFQIWASFLHDCKYYWKLAQRNLARDKFTAELTIKSQMSSSSLPGFNSLKTTMMRHVASFSQDDEMRESRARQLEHINSWIESVGRYTLEMTPGEDADNYDDDSGYPTAPPPLPPPPNLPLAQQEYHYHDHHQNNNQFTHPNFGEAPGGDEIEAENAEDRDCPTPVNQPETDHKTNNFTNHQQGQQVVDSKDYHRSDSHSRREDLSYPYYKNVLSNTQHELYDKKHHHAGFKQSKQKHKDFTNGEDFDQVQTSPKPIKAIPPNVIKPQPITQASPTVSSPSPTSPHIHTIQFAQPLPRVDTNNNDSAKKYDSSHNGGGSKSGNSRAPGYSAPLGNDQVNINFPEDDNFGFEPLYESLSRHAFRQPRSPPCEESESPPPYTDNNFDQCLFHHPHSQFQNQTANENIPSPEGSHPHKKNGNFFKSLLKRDSKQRTPSDSGEQQQQQGLNSQHDRNQHSALRSVSAPFNKFRNTVVQKFSGGSSSKKSHSENVKSPSFNASNSTSSKKYQNDNVENSNSNGSSESPPKPVRGLLVDQAQEFYNEGSINSNKTYSSGTNEVNYQNYFYPGQPRRADMVSQESRDNNNQDDGGFKKYDLTGRSAAVMLVNSGHRDGHDSLPSTVSSRHSGMDQGLSMYRESQCPSQSKNRSKRRDCSTDHLAVQPSDYQSSPDNRAHNNEGDNYGESSRQSNIKSGRIRAPIALGSNISISDMYGKATEAAISQISDGDEQKEISEIGSSAFKGNGPTDTGVQQLHLTSPLMGKGENAIPKSITAEPKWVKATAVPIYKAKLIPNYENQTKYDPKLEGGVRGHAAPVTSLPVPKHAPQVSNSSEMYRQELQKKSGQYVVGGGGVAVHQDSSFNSNSKGRNNMSHTVVSSAATSAFPGAPTSYTVLPPKFSSSHYHTSPVVLSPPHSSLPEQHQSLNPGKSSGNNDADIYPRSSSSPPPLHQQNEYHSSSGDDQNTESRHMKAVAASMFTVSPDGRLELEPSRSAHSAEVGPLGAQKSQHQSRRVVARRSSSANNILDKAPKTSSDNHGKRHQHAADDNVRHYRHEQFDKEISGNNSNFQGHVSRRDDATKKTTPTSSGRLAAPQSIIPLIDRFEQSPHPNHLLGSLSPSSNLLHPPLMEDDKPPSMTSTPLARRKNGREDGRVVSPPVSLARSDDASTHSHSTSSRKSSGRHHVDYQKQHHQNLAKSPETRNHRYQKYEDHSSHSHRKYNSGHKSNTKRSGSYPEMSQQNLIKDTTACVGSIVHSPQNQNHYYESGSSSSSHYHQHHPSKSQTINKKRKDEKISSFIDQKAHKNFLQGENPLNQNHVAHILDSSKDIRSSSQGAGSSQDRGRSFGHLDERMTYSSQSHRPDFYHATPLVTSSSSNFLGSAYHSSFLPKPEPQYPNQEKQQKQNQHLSRNKNNVIISTNSSNHNNGNGGQLKSDRNSTHPRQKPGQASPITQQNYNSPSPTSNSNSNIINNNTNAGSNNFNSNNNNVGKSHSVQQVHGRPSPHIHYISPLAAPQTAQHSSNITSSNSSNNNNNNNNTTNQSNAVSVIEAESCGNDLYTAELRRAIKSSNSAFDRPLKSGPPYGRQPGAMAVVKPTVMNP